MAHNCIAPMGDCLCPTNAPSPIFTTFAVGINFVGGLWAVIVAFSASSTCDRATRTWVLAGAGSNLVNAVFAVYLYFQFRAKVRGYASGGTLPFTTNTMTQEAPMRPGEAAARLLLYDWGVCLYFLVCIWEIVFCVLAHTNYGSSNYPHDDCATQLSSAIYILILYAIIGVVLIFFSLFTECCRQPRWHESAQSQRRSYYQTNPAQAAANAVTGAATSGVNAVRRAFGVGPSPAQPVAARDPYAYTAVPVATQQQQYAQQQAVVYQQPYAHATNAVPQARQADACGDVYVRPPPVNPSYQPQHS